MHIDVNISNLSEDIWPFVESLAAKDHEFEVSENAFLSDRDILTLPTQNQTIFVAPAELDPDFVTYYRELFNHRQLEVWVPQKHTGQTSLDLMTDEQLFKRLVALGQQHTLVLTSYSGSQQFYDLVDALREQGCQVETPETPPKQHAWTINFFGSKSGVRQATQQLAEPDKPWMAEGVISYGLFDIASLAASWYCQDGGVVLKTNKAHSGAGVKIFRPGELPTEFEACQVKIYDFLHQETYWQTFPVVIEKYLDIDNQVGGGNPNCEFKIGPDGKPQLLYYCGMRVTPAGVFKGVEIHEDVLSEDIITELVAYGDQLGQEYTEAGYRGYFDVDCVFTLDKRLLVTESNVRRTGGTHVYHAAVQLCGPDFMHSRYVLSNNTYPLPGTRELSFAELHQQLQPVLFSPDTKEGVVIAAANLLKQNKMAYIIFGQTKERAVEIETQMEKLLAT